ncbi:MAG: HAMP domain-containing sensor histidine kinase [Pseudomonadota bacterium]
MNSLFARLATALLVIVVLMGGAFIAVDRVNTRVFYEELSQSLNAPIAMYITAQEQLIADGVPNLDALGTLAARAMVVNPTAEIYLLDRDGRILGHGLTDQEPALSAVDLAPIQRFVDGEARLPLRGSDPRDGLQEKIFSAWAVMNGDRLEGYVYVVLGGRTYEALAADISESYAGRISLLAFGTIAAFAVIVGVLTFLLLTRRLKHLRREVDAVVDSGFQYSPKLVNRGGGGDEIDALTSAFDNMSARIQEQIEQLKQNDKLRRELVSNVSHDLRTPLAAMQGYIETLILRHESLGSEDRLRYLNIARKHTVRLGQLISDLFELSKLDAASITPSMESFSLPELMQDVAQEFRIEAEARGISLRIVGAERSGYTLGDIGLIQRVLENLVRNAVKFTPSGGEIVLSVAQHPDTVAVSVSDTGSGIAEEDLPKIFDRFYRARDGEEARSDSSGIGLAIVKRILDLHGSRITVSSQLDAGTRFEFELPAARQAA